MHCAIVWSIEFFDLLHFDTFWNLTPNSSIQYALNIFVWILIETLEAFSIKCILYILYIPCSPNKQKHRHIYMRNKKTYAVFFKVPHLHITKLINMDIIIVSLSFKYCKSMCNMFKRSMCFVTLEKYQVAVVKQQNYIYKKAIFCKWRMSYWSLHTLPIF